MNLWKRREGRRREVDTIQRKQETVGDREKLFGDDRKRLEVDTIVDVVAVDEEFEDGFPTVIR